MRRYWTATGVIPRWQLILAYILIAGAFAFTTYNVVHDGQNTQEAIVRECQVTNQRHDDTYKSLVDAAAIDEDNAKTGAAKAEVRRRRDVTLALIDALAPKRDCDNLIR